MARRDLSIARKSDDAGSYVGPEIGIGPDGVSLPKGAVSGVALEALLRRLTVRQADSDFGRLPIPFRAIATEVSNGEMVVLDHGNLAQAVRASMAIPAVISPVEIDGQLLVDGGIARNLPVDVARAMGANVIIPINIGSPLLRRDQIKSVLSMSEQMTRMLTASNLRTSLAELNPQVDVLITPDLANVDAASFDLLKEAEGYGEQAARQATDRLRRYAVPADDYAVLSARRHGAQAPEGVLLSAVHIDGTQRVPEASLRGTMVSVHRSRNGARRASA
ncbi:patatin-like phospholipase family protein [Rugamonas sp. A1-17]|nr:patatin-like phospholipase family protein [Rugamonas sp. A1-17]